MGKPERVREQEANESKLSESQARLLRSAFPALKGASPLF